MDTKPFYTTRAFYLSMTALFVMVLAIVFVTGTRALITQVDTTLATENATQGLLTLNSEHYAILEQKLSLPAVAPTPSTEATTTDTSALPATTTPPLATSTPTQETPAIDLTALTVVVRNATGIAGLAGKIRDEMVTAGFREGTTGNAAAQPDNEVYIRDDVRDAVTAVLETKLPSFMQTAKIMATNPKSADIVIIIGHQ